MRNLTQPGSKRLIVQTVKAVPEPIRSPSGAEQQAESMLTRYPLGVVKVLPFTVHSAGDYLAAALLVLSPVALWERCESGVVAVASDSHR